MIDLSIVIPVYNGARYLEGCLKSIHFNDGVAIEIIMADDGSTDQSVEIIKEYQKNDYRITLYELDKNHGLGYVRKFLLNKANGKFIYCIDNDDEIIFNNVIAAYKLANKYELDVFVGECIKMENPNEVVVNTSLANQIITGKEFYIFSSKGKFKGIGFWRNIYNREFLVKHNIFDVEDIVYIDNYSFPIIHKYAQRVMYQDIKLYKYFVRDNSISTSTNNYLQKIYSRKIIISHYLDILKEQAGDKAFRKATFNFISYSLLRMYTIDTKLLDKKEVKFLYQSIPNKAYIYAMLSNSRKAKIVCPILLINIYMGKKLLNLISKG